MYRRSLALRTISFFLAASILLTSCASTTMIQSEPSGAKLYLNGEPVGTTPYTHTDTRIVGTTTMVKLEKEGYEALNTTFSRDEEADVGAIIGGFLFLFPFLWTMKYKPARMYELEPVMGDDMVPGEKQLLIKPLKSKADRLREFKKLLDEGVITQEEFEREKKKILEEEER